jgi:microsomal dipeptidase-like Zn-dependent dipeptidase
MRNRTLALALAATLLAAACATDEPAPDDAGTEAREIHDRVLTIDSHDDIPGTFGTADYNACNAMDRQVDVPAMREGGLDVAFFIVYVGQGPRTPEGNENALEQALRKFEGIRAMAEEQCPDQIEIAYRADDVQRIHDAGKLVSVIGIENGYPIGNDISLIERFHDLGGRYMTLAHTSHNDIADSSNPTEPEHGGLSPFGEQVVTEMNRVGMMVDVSHVSKDAALHAMRISRAPVIASHSSTRAVADHVRNMDDETLLALQQNGGVIQIVAFDGYVKVQPASRGEEMDTLANEFGIPGGRGGRGAIAALPDSVRVEYERRRDEIAARYPGATVADFVDHIDHAVRLIGIDHVGISSDFDGGGGVTGWDDAAETFNVTVELLSRGYSEEEIAKLWGQNLLRVWRDVERIAGEIQAGA